MGLAWQQGRLAPGAVGRFLAPDPPRERIARGPDRDLTTGEVTPSGQA
jgi:hypothetical protein